MTDVVHGCLQSLYLLRHLKDSMLSSPQQGNNHLLWSAASSDYPPDLQLQLLQEEVFDGIGKYAATCIRLCVRCEKFQYVQYLLANKALLTRQYEAGLRKLQSVLDEALTYIKSMMKRVLDSEITTVKFRLTHAKEVSRITLQLFAMESNLLLASARKERDFEEERMQHKAEDLEDFMEFFAWSLSRVLEEMELYFDDLLRQVTSPATNIDELSATQSQASMDEFSREVFDEQMLLLHQHVHSSKAVMAQVMALFEHDNLTIDEQEHIDTQTIQLHYKINAFHRLFYIRHQLLPSAVFSTSSFIRSLLINELTLTPLQQMERDLILDALATPVTTIEMDAKELMKRSKEALWLQGRFGGQTVAILKLPPPQPAVVNNSQKNSPTTTTIEYPWKPYEDELLLLNFLQGSSQKSPEIVSSFGYFVDRNHLNILYADYGAYGSLQDFFEQCSHNTTLRKSFPTVLALFWMKDLLSALIHLQKMKIKHNFLLPQNVLLCPQMCLKIRNFQAATSYQPKQEVSIKAPSVAASRRKSPRVEALQYAISSFNPHLAVYTRDGPSDIYAFAMLALSILCLEDVSQLGQEKERINHTVQNIDEDKIMDREVLADLLVDGVKTEVDGLPPTSRPDALELMTRLRDIIEVHGGDARQLKKSPEYKAVIHFEQMLQQSNTLAAAPTNLNTELDDLGTRVGTKASPIIPNDVSAKKPSTKKSSNQELCKAIESPSTKVDTHISENSDKTPSNNDRNHHNKETMLHEILPISSEVKKSEGNDEEHDNYGEGEGLEEGSIAFQALTSIECLSLLNHIGCSFILSAKDLSGEKLLNVASLADLVNLGISLPSGVRASKALEYLQAYQRNGSIPLSVLASSPLPVMEEKQKVKVEAITMQPINAENSQQDGIGLRILPEGVYEGELVNSMRDGIGIMRYHTGDVYEGEWMLDVRQGQGVMLYSNGDRFEGFWDKGSFRGHGTYNFRL